MPDQSLMLFRNVHEVMKADRLLRGKGISCRVVPVPEQISSECGMCLVIDPENSELCCALLKDHDISYDVFNRESL
ncbi:MAG: DUF3343 domain-containing protein [Marinilabiliaceae bacterium]